MQLYLLDIVNKVKDFSKKLDEKSLLENNHWVLLDELNNKKVVYIFRPRNELLISIDGKVTISSWEYLGCGSLLIKTSKDNYLFKNGFFDAMVLALKIDGSEEFALFVNETKYGKEINNFADLSNYMETTYVKDKSIIPNYPKDLPEPIVYGYNDDICPACNHIGVFGLLECPKCELNYR